MTGVISTCERLKPHPERERPAGLRFGLRRFQALVALLIYGIFLAAMAYDRRQTA